jgi:cytidine deaminase
MGELNELNGSHKWKGDFLMADEPIIDLQSDHYFMGEALRQAAKAYSAEEVPVGAVVVREGRVIARAFNQVELLKDATAHAEMLALTQAEEAMGDWRLTDVRRGNCSRAPGPCGVRRERSQGGCRGQRAESVAVPHLESPL